MIDALEEQMVCCSMSPTFRPIGDLCERGVFSIDPKREPGKEFWYIDISAVDNSLKQISTPQRVKGKAASVRARQIIRKNDVLVSTTRPNLNAVALVPEKYNGEICSTGFCVLRCGKELDPDYLFSFVQSQLFVGALTELVKGALYPAVTDKQVFAQLIPWHPIDDQRRIATHLKAQLAAVEDARQAAQVRQAEFSKLRSALLVSAFAEAGGEMVKLVEVAEINPRRLTLNFLESELVTFVPMESVDEEAGEIVRSVQRPFSQVKKGYTVFAENDVLFAKITPCMQNGKHAVARGLIKKTGFGSTEFHVIRAGKEIEPEWIHFFLRRKETLDAAIKSFTGSVGQQRVPAFFLENLDIPLAMIEQQKLITAHLKSQLAAVDEAEAASAAQLAEIERLPARLLAQAFSMNQE